MLGDKYILIGKNPVKTDDDNLWAQWFNDIIAQDRAGEFFIITTFLGLDYNRNPGERPILFETAVYNGLGERQVVYCRYYSEHDEAEAGHGAVVAALGGTQ